MKLKDIYNKYEPLMRVDGWTTNGFWNIRSKYEPKSLTKRAVTREMPKESMDMFIKRTLDTKYSVTCDKGREITLERYSKPVIPFTVSKAGAVRYFNARYIELFERAGATNYCMSSYYEYSPLIIYKNNTVIGFVMPLKFN